MRYRRFSPDRRALLTAAAVTPFTGVTANAGVPDLSPAMPSVRADPRVLPSVLDYEGIDPTGIADSTAAINKAIQGVGSGAFTSYPNADGSTVAIHHSTACLVFPPGRYRTTDTMLVNKGITLWAPGGHSSAVIEYAGTGHAVVINNTFTGAYNARQAEENVRAFRWEGLALNAPNASTGVLIGSTTLRYIEFLSGQIINVQGRGIDAGEAVYFMRLGNFDLINNDVGAYIGPYCDLFTMNDRCYVASHKTTGLILEAPSYHIENNDFEGNRGPIAQIIINSRAAVADGSRAGVIFNNRFGPERTVTTGTGARKPSPYDIAITESGGGAVPVMSSIRLRDNNFFSRNAGADRKIAPVLLNARVQKLDVDGNTSNLPDYSSGYQVATTNAALCGRSGSVWNNTIDDVRWVDPQIRGLFKGYAPTGYVRAAAAQPSFVKYQTVYRAGYSAGAEWEGEPSPVAVGIADATTRANYRNAAGITTYASGPDQQDKPIWLAGRGATLQTIVDFTGQPLGTPVYKSGNGFALVSPTFAEALIVGRTASASTNGQMLVTLEGASAVQGSVTYNPTALSNGDGAVTTVTATGAAVGDFARATFSNDLRGVILHVWVSAVDIVSVRFQNESGGPVDLGSGMLRVRVEKAG